MDQTVPSGHPAVLPPLGYPFNPPTLYEGPIKFDPALPHFGAFPKPDGSAMEQSRVPVLPQQAGVHRLSSIEKQELELARRRAEKAAEGKRANAAAARAKRRATRPRTDDRGAAAADAEAEEASHEEEDDLEAKLATTRDEKEAKRLRRLLRNRVSAQQARERKKSYVSNLEAQAKKNEQMVAKLQQQVKTLERENVMLRQVIRNMQGLGEKSLDNA